MPVLFVGHGSPLNAIEDNEWSRAFRALGARLPKPRAILAVSAHWYVPGTYLTANDRPETIHDFGGFPKELYEMRYPAPGDPRLAGRVAGLLEIWKASLRSDWGLDHGTWSVLLHLRPAADVPVVQLSIHSGLTPREHLAIGRTLAPLRDEGVLILGSGNIVHNLGDAFRRLREGNRETPPWAERFDRAVARALEEGDAEALAGALDGPDAPLAHPTHEHYLPLLYAAGAAGEDGRASFPITGFDLGSLSMRTGVFE